MISIGVDCVLHRYAEGTPEHRKANAYLAGGFRGILFCLTGDLDYFNAIVKAPNWNSASPCIHCPATTSGPNTWSDFLPTAMWQCGYLECHGHKSSQTFTLNTPRM